ncbi:hypothetical protein [Nitrogeniibacter aestuarii]|uniref:hypothetical protein n=1 Tax=Nitrogeniibacter aestuarii TaxID=2815343 RepID=UPI001D101405|nr:hypothetical protein [Nitrogeniibacter aestuarii]
MIHIFEFLRYPLALVLIGYSLYGVLKGSIRVGSRSHTGGVTTIHRAASPLRFYFWCAFFIAIGLACLFVPFVDES